jgi:uncharacterized damage-inducible protein DinB
MPDMKTEDTDDLAMRSFRKLAVNNVLANYRLSRAVMALPPVEFSARRTSFFPSLKATLNHIYYVDWLYIDALCYGELGPWPHAGEEPFDDPSELSAAQHDLDIKLFALCQNHTSKSLGDIIGIDRGDRVQHERMDDILTHLFQHQTHHRGQVHAMLAGATTKPPQLDEFIVADDAKFRKDELAAMGWDERWLEFEPPPGSPRLPFPG